MMVWLEDLSEKIYERTEVEEILDIGFIKNDFTSRLNRCENATYKDVEGSYY